VKFKLRVNEVEQIDKVWFIDEFGDMLMRLKVCINEVESINEVRDFYR